MSNSVRVGAILVLMACELMSLSGPETSDEIVISADDARYQGVIDGNRSYTKSANISHPPVVSNIRHDSEPDGEPAPAITIDIIDPDCISPGGLKSVSIRINRRERSIEAAGQNAFLLLLTSLNITVFVPASVTAKRDLMEMPYESETLTIPFERFRDLHRHVIAATELKTLTDAPLPVEFAEPAALSEAPVVAYLIVPHVGHFWKEIRPCAAQDSGASERDRDMTAGVPLTPTVDHSLPLGKRGVQAGGTITVALTVTFADDTGSSRPLRYALIELWDSDTFTLDDQLGTQQTDGNGKVTFTGVVNSDESGGLDLYFKLRTLEFKDEVQR